MDSRSPSVVLLVGQPTLVRSLPLGVFTALDRRIATRCQVRPTALAEATISPTAAP
jgi:type II secretory pathway predicted ATPase ExeA